MKRISVIIALLATFCVSGFAKVTNGDLSRLKQRVGNEKQYPVGERFQITYTIEMTDSVKSPEFSSSDFTVSIPGIDSIKGLKFEYGPAVANSQSYTVINHKTSITNLISYLFSLKATEPGHYKLPAFRVIDKSTGKPLGLPLVHAEFSVVPKDGNANGSTTPDKKTFLRMTIDNDTIELGSSAKLTLRMLTNEVPTTVSNLSCPDINDCFVAPIEIDSVSGSSVEFEGADYTEYIIGKYNITPLKSGRFTIKPVTAECSISPSVMDIFSSGSSESKSVNLSSNELNLTVVK